MAYLSVAEWKSRTIMPGGDVDALEAQEPGFLSNALGDWTDEIEDRLRKRYAVPFVAPYPRAVLRWLTVLVTRDAYSKRGFNPSSEQDTASIITPAERAEASIKEAADSKDGLYDLPLRADALDASGIVKGEPMGDAQASPYSWVDAQAEALNQ